MKKIRVLIADDHVIVREGLRAILEAQEDIEVAGEATDGSGALKKAKELRPDIILMDITMPGTDGIQATKQIRQLDPNIKILVLTMHESDDYFFSMLQAGASGYFIKGGSSIELLGAIRAVWRDEVFIYPTLAKKLVHDYLQGVVGGQHKESYDGLTNREQEILKLIAEGNSNQAIADRLVLSVTTVQTHRAHIMSKLGLRSRTELIKYAIKRGFITLDT